jgi:hypothetical protein
MYDTELNSVDQEPDKSESNVQTKNCIINRIMNQNYGGELDSPNTLRWTIVNGQFRQISPGN